MRNLRALLALMAGLTLIAVSPGAAQSQSARTSEVRGGIHVTMHTHSNDDPDWPGLLFDTDRLSYNFSRGEDFSYSSRVCGGRAPFNDLGLDFRPDYPGVDNDDGTAPVRHRMQGTITTVERGGRGTVSGKTTSVLCSPQGYPAQAETGHSIVTHYTAKYTRVSNNEIRLSGTFQISPSESTGTFQGLTGHGSLQGSLTCLGHQRDRKLPSCQAQGHFTDFTGIRGDPSKGPGEIRPGLMGTFRDPSVLTG